MICEQYTQNTTTTCRVDEWSIRFVFNLILSDIWWFHSNIYQDLGMEEMFFSCIR